MKTRGGERDRLLADEHAHLTNEGGGNAFNVRFGVDFDGVRYAWKFSSEDTDNGSYQRVVRVGTRLPEDGASFNIEIPWEKFAIGRCSLAAGGRCCA